MGGFNSYALWITVIRWEEILDTHQKSLVQAMHPNPKPVRGVGPLCLLAIFTSRNNGFSRSKAKCKAAKKLKQSHCGYLFF